MIKSNIRILYISNASSIHLRRWAKSFADRHYEVHVASPTPWGEATVKTTVMPLYPYGASNTVSRMVSGARNVMSIRKFMRKLHPQIIHLHGLFTVFGPDLMFTIFRQKNLVVSTWGSDVVFIPREKEPFRSQAIKKFIFRQAAAVLATSKYQCRVTQKYCPKHLRVAPIPYGVDLELFRKDEKAHKPSGVITLGFVKRLEENYGPHTLIEAFELVERKHKNARLLIVGDGSMRKSLEEKIRQMGLTGKVSFIGWLENRRIPEFLNRMDIFVMPTLQETFGVAAVEAQAVQVPVVASDIEGIREVVLHGKTGYLARPGEPEAFAKWINKLIEDPQAREKMGIEGRRFVSERYDWQKCVDSVERVYCELLGEKLYSPDPAIGPVH